MMPTATGSSMEEDIDIPDDIVYKYIPVFSFIIEWRIFKK